MKRLFFFLFALLLLFGTFSIYQYTQYQQQFEALKATTHNQTTTTMPVDTVAVARPPDEAYYNHHQQLSTILYYNPLLRATIESKLYFYDYTQHNDALLDFYNLLNYRERLLAQASPTEHHKIEQQIQQYREQLCTRWEAFAKHLQQTYPNMTVAAGLNNLCTATVVHAYHQADINSWMIDPTKK